MSFVGWVHGEYAHAVSDTLWRVSVRLHRTSERSIETLGISKPHLANRRFREWYAEEEISAFSSGTKIDQSLVDDEKYEDLLPWKSANRFICKELYLKLT